MTKTIVAKLAIDKDLESKFFEFEVKNSAKFKLCSPVNGDLLGEINY
jgi:hypothetical protein